MPEESTAAQEAEALWEKFISLTFGNADYYYWWWLGLLGLVLVLFLFWRFKASRKNFRVFRDESGVAETTNSALKDLVHIACDGVETASKPRIKFRKRHGRIDVQIRAKLYQGQKLGEVRDQMRKRVQKIFQDTHGILVGDVSFTATGFKKSNKQIVIEEMDEEPKPKSSALKTKQETPKEEPAPEPAKEKKFGWSEPKPPAKEEPAKEPESAMPAYRREEPKKEEPKVEAPKPDGPKKSGLFGGFGNKKVEPEAVAEAPKKHAGDPLDDQDDFSALLAENDEKLDDKK